MNSEADKRNKKARYKAIVDILTREGGITIAEIAERFQVTTETARKDLMALEANGLAKRYHGGAEPVSRSDFHEGMLLKQRLVENADKKSVVATAAAELVHDGDTVMIDSGSTLYLLAQNLLGFKNLVVITSSLPVATLMSENKIRTLMLGGEIFEADSSVGGPWVDYCLNNIFADIAFIGASCISNTAGPDVENFTASNVKSAMLSHAKRKYIVADSSKYYSSPLISFTAWDKVDGVIVNGDIPREFRQMIGDRTRILTAE